jgi:hypothetical protein
MVVGDDDEELLDAKFLNVDLTKIKVPESFGLEERKVVGRDQVLRFLVEGRPVAGLRVNFHFPFTCPSPVIHSPATTYRGNSYVHSP